VTNVIQVASKQLSQETASHSRSSSEDGRSHSRGSSDTTAPPVPLVPSGGTITQHFSLPPQQPTGPKTTQQLRQISAASLYASKEAAKAMASNISHRFSQYLHSRNTAHSSSGGGSSATANISSSKLETSLSNMAIGNESVAATIINNESSSKLETPSSITTTTTSNNIESPSKPETSSNATSDYKDLN
jgi:hypothetical protein